MTEAHHGRYTNLSFNIDASKGFESGPHEVSCTLKIEQISGDRTSMFSCGVSLSELKQMKNAMELLLANHGNIDELEGEGITKLVVTMGK